MVWDLRLGDSEVERSDLNVPSPSQLEGDAIRLRKTWIVNAKIVTLCGIFESMIVRWQVKF